MVLAVFVVGTKVTSGVVELYIIPVPAGITVPAASLVVLMVSTSFVYVRVPTFHVYALRYYYRICGVEAVPVLAQCSGAVVDACRRLYLEALACNLLGVTQGIAEVWRLVVAAVLVYHLRTVVEVVHEM